MYLFSINNDLVCSVPHVTIKINNNKYNNGSTI